MEFTVYLFVVYMKADKLGRLVKLMRAWWLMCIEIIIARYRSRCCTLVGKNGGKISLGWSKRRWMQVKYVCVLN